MPATEQEHVIDATAGDLVAAERLPPELMLLKMENETIMAAARVMPRDPMKIVAQLKQLIEAYPAAADEAIYSKPVGTVHEITCGQCGVKYESAQVNSDITCPACDSPKHDGVRRVKKFAEGLSIRAAESIRSIYGYTRLATTTDLLPDGKAKITGVLVDYAAGNVTSDERIVSPFYKAKGGKMTRTPEDRFINVVVKAEKAKLRRDVILDSVPNIVKAMFRDECEQKLEGLISPELIEQKIIPAFAEYGITLVHLEKIIGRAKGLGWRESDRLALKKILVALKNEETTVRELLDGLDNGTSQPSQQDKPSGPVSTDNLTKPQGKSEPDKQGELPSLDKALAELKTATTIKAVDDITVEYMPAMESDGDAADLAYAADERKEAIRAARDGKKSPQGELEMGA